jgi:hypothetical protein
MSPRYLLLAGIVLAWLISPADTLAQQVWKYGGFMESTAQIYPHRPNPSDTHALASGHVQLWTQGRFGDRLLWRGSADFRLDTHGDVDEGRWFDLEQRSLRQPASSLRELYLDIKLDQMDLRLGQQEIRWGRADRFNPTDNVIPYDYLSILSEERLPVPALKADAYVGRARFEVVWVPWFTPTRLPLLNQRWFPQLPAVARVPFGPTGEVAEVDLLFRDGNVAFPARTFANGQWGARWNQLVSWVEFSLSYFDGFDDIAFFRPRFAVPSGVAPRPRIQVTLDREYHRVRVAGADFASELGSFGIRGELAYVDQMDPLNRDRLVFVVGVDRTWGDWFAILQYTDQIPAGNIPPGTPIFPDQGLRSTILTRFERTISPSQSFEVRGALSVRDGDFLVQLLYDIALTDAWRLKLGLTLFAGPRTSFLGQYRDSGHLNIQLRYTF